MDPRQFQDDLLKWMFCYSKTEISMIFCHHIWYLCSIYTGQLVVVGMLVKIKITLFNDCVYSWPVTFLLRTRWQLSDGNSLIVKKQQPLTSYSYRFLVDIDRDCKIQLDLSIKWSYIATPCSSFDEILPLQFIYFQTEVSILTW